MPQATSPWTYEPPRGCLTTAGAGLLLVSVLSTVSVLAGMAYGDGFWATGMLLFAAACVPVGLWLAFGRKGVTVDVEAGTVREYQLVFIPLKERFLPLGDFRTVSILREKLRKMEDLSHLYHVCLVSPAVTVEVAVPPAYEVARAIAVQLAEVTGLPLVDGQWHGKG